MKKVSIIIPIHNGIKDTLTCLKSLKALSYPKSSYDVIIVDNASTDNSSDKIGQRSSKIKIINIKKNLGFAAAVNKGIKSTNSDYYFIINNDIFLNKGSLKKLVDFMESNEAVGVCGGRILNGTSGSQVLFSGVKFNKWTGAIQPMPNSDEVIETEWVQGCAMLIRKAVFKKIGLFDEGFFFSFEDADFCLRARRAGFNIVCIPENLGRHKESGTIDTFGQRKKGLELYKAKFRYVFKNCNWLQIISISIFQFFVIAPVRIFFFKKQPFYITSMFLGYTHSLKGIINKR